MRKVILDLAVTLDGFIEGVNGEIDWCIQSRKINYLKKNKYDNQTKIRKVSN